MSKNWLLYELRAIARAPYHVTYLKEVNANHFFEISDRYLYI